MIHNVKNLLFGAWILFFAAGGYSYQVGDWIELSGEYYFVLERTDHAFDEGRACFYPASIDLSSTGAEKQF